MTVRELVNILKGVDQSLSIKHQYGEITKLEITQAVTDDSTVAPKTLTLK